MLLLVLLLTQGPQGSQGPIALHSGQVITRSTRVLRRTYRISGVVIRGDNITVDFAGATLQGTPADTAIHHARDPKGAAQEDRKSTRLNSSHTVTSYAV